MEVAIATIILCVLLFLLLPVYDHGNRLSARRSASASNVRQIAIAGQMYAGDYDDGLPLATNGWWSRLQDRSGKQLTVNCPAPGTQIGVALDAAGAQPTRTWVLLLEPYVKSRLLYVDVTRGRSGSACRRRIDPDPYGIFAGPPLDSSDPDYDPEKNTFRNQGRFPQFGLNYMFLAPLRIPKSKLSDPNSMNYMRGEGRSFAQAIEPAATVFFVQSRHNLTDPYRGSFCVNAPGMWSKLLHNKQGYIAWWTGTLGSGDWVASDTACADSSVPCKRPIKSHGQAYLNDIAEAVQTRGGANATFLDGHVKFTKAATLAAGTDYLTATAGSKGHPGGGCVITDKSKYLWNLDANYYEP